MSGWKKLAAASAADDAIGPEGVSFDGQNDYLSKTSGLSGATDGKTFTLSFWFYSASTTSGDQRVYHSNDTGSGWPRFAVILNLSGAGANLVQIVSYPSDFNVRLNMNCSANSLAVNTWTHVLVSVDMTSQANSKIYINDEIASVTFGTFINTDLAFANDEHKIGAETSSAGRLKGRLAHFYFDYTHRNLGTESNRRLFITDDLKPADGLASLSPIIYLPMTGADTAGDNSGTGGDFTVNGTLDTAQRGPNQYNAVASVFDGSADKLTTTSLSGVSDGKQATFSVNFRLRSFNDDPFIAFEQAGGMPFVVRISNAGSYGYLTIIGWQPNEFTTLSFSQPGTDLKVYLNRNHSLQLSFDLTDSSKRHIILDGEEITGLTWATYNNNNINFTTPTVALGADGSIGNRFLDGEMGEVYFDTVYTDLASDNPFWDDDASLHKPVRQVLEETGNTPLIAMPIYGNDAGDNLGTGGDFTVNSGPFTGARGASEFWQRSCFTGTSSPRGYLTNNSVFSGVSNSKEMTLFFALNRRDNGNGRYFFRFDNSSAPSSTYMQLRGDQGNGAYWYFNSQNGGNILNTTSSSAVFSYQDWNVFALSVDLTNTSNRHFYKNRSSEGMNWSDYANTDIPWSQFNRISIFSQSSTGSSQYWNQYTGPFYLATEYIDFSDQSNLNFFIDQLGYPKDLTSAIENGDIPNPVIYLPFDEVDDFGKNLGTGGDFTVNNTLTSGSDVDPDA